MRGHISAALAIVAAMILGCSQEQAGTDPETYLVQGSPQPAKTLVVFIHGVLGDPRGTWASAGDIDGWPGLLAHDPKAPSIDTLSIGYRSQKMSAASNIEEISVRLLQSLQDRGVFEQYDQIGIVAHSMGGLVTKRMLRVMSNSHPTQFGKIKVVIFLSTPAHGSNQAEMASWVSSNPQFQDMQPSDFNTFLQILDNDWRGLLSQRPAGKLLPRVYCAYETLPTATLKIVPRSLSEPGCDATAVPFDRDHLSIAKPISVDDAVYVFVRARLLSAFDPKTVEQRISISIVRPNGTILGPDEHMRSADQYFILLEATRPAWFYVYGRDSADKVEKYFPSAAAGQQTGPLASLRIPNDAQRFLVLDNTTGLERIYVSASDQPNVELDRINEIGDAKPDEVAKLLASELRGSYVASPLNAGRATAIPAIKDGTKAFIFFEHR